MDVLILILFFFSLVVPLSRWETTRGLVVVVLFASLKCQSSLHTYAYTRRDWRPRTNLLLCDPCLFRLFYAFHLKASESPMNFQHSACNEMPSTIVDERTNEWKNEKECQNAYNFVEKLKAQITMELCTFYAWKQVSSVNVIIVMNELTSVEMLNHERKK